jgi:hypothetical protein
MACGNHLTWIPINDNPLAQSAYPYITTGEIETSWIYGEFKDLPKFWKSLKLFTELPTGTTITAQYKTDNGATWLPVSPLTFATSPVTEVALSASNDVVGKRIKFKFILTCPSPYTTTPRIKVAVIEAITRVPIKRLYSFSFLVEDYYAAGYDFERKTNNAYDLLTVMDGWADVNTRTHPVIMTTIFKNVVDVLALIDPAELRPIEVRNEASGVFETRMIGRVQVLAA